MKVCFHDNDIWSTFFVCLYVWCHFNLDYTKITLPEKEIEHLSSLLEKRTTVHFIHCQWKLYRKPQYSRNDETTETVAAGSFSFLESKNEQNKPKANTTWWITKRANHAHLKFRELASHSHCCQTLTLQNATWFHKSSQNDNWSFFCLFARKEREIFSTMKRPWWRN